jgi:hypothetical protein
MLRQVCSSKLSRVIQRKTDGRYYAGEGNWTGDVQGAKSFESVMQVVQECEQSGRLPAASELIIKVAPEETGFRAII